jgi:hypothetical protein
MTPLCELSRKYGTDKGGEHIPYGDPNHCCHNYTPIYYDLFKARRDDTLTLLEIGVSEGKSIHMWREFFPLAAIYGWDLRIDRFEGAPPPSVHLRCVDQSNADSLYEALMEIGNPRFDIIIDDGSHIYEHQVTALGVLLPFLKPDGIYVVEDHTEPQRMIPDSILPTGWTNTVHTDTDWRNVLQVIRRAS